MRRVELNVLIAKIEIIKSFIYLIKLRKDQNVLLLYFMQRINFKR